MALQAVYDMAYVYHQMDVENVLEYMYISWKQHDLSLNWRDIEYKSELHWNEKYQQDKLKKKKD